MVVGNPKLARMANASMANRNVWCKSLLFAGIRPYVLGSLFIHVAVFLPLALFRGQEHAQPDISFTEGRSAVSVQFVYLKSLRPEPVEKINPSVPPDNSATIPPVQTPPEEDTATAVRNSPKVISSAARPVNESHQPVGQPAPGVKKTVTSEPADHSKALPLQKPADTRSQNQNADVKPVGVRTPAKIRSRVTPVYPMRSRRKGERGEVVIKAIIDMAGKVVTCHVVKSSGFPRLDRSAVSAMMKSTFTSTAANGVNGPRSVELTFRFRLTEG